MTTTKSTLSSAGWLIGGGEMGERIRARDWSRSPLGPPERWQQSLRTAVGMLLASGAQIALFWGPEFVVLYNDAYRPVFGGKHPSALGLPGREAWSEIWEEQLGPLLQGVVDSGESFGASDLLFMLQRHGFAEETYFDISYDPVRDEEGRVAGVNCIVTETTGRVVNERRLRALSGLGRVGMGARTMANVLERAGVELAGHPEDVAFALLYMWDADAGVARMCAQAGIATDHPAVAAEIRPGAGPWPLGPDLAAEGVVLEGAALPRRAASRRALARALHARGGDPHRDIRAITRRVRRRGNQPATPAGQRLSRLPPPRGLGHRQRAGVDQGAGSGAQARRLPRRARPRQDRLLQQREPRVPHAADTDARPAARRRSTRRGSPRRCAQRLEVSHRNGAAPAASSSTRCSTSRASRPGACRRVFEATDLAALHGRAREQLRLRAATRRASRSTIDCPPLPEAASRRPRHVGEDRPEPAVERVQVHVRRRASR